MAPLKKFSSLVCVLSRLSRGQLFATLWTIACQAPPSTGFSRQEYWNGLPCPPPGDLPHPGIEPTSPTSPASQTDYFTAEPWGKPFHILNSENKWLITDKKKVKSEIHRIPFPIINVNISPPFSLFLNTPFSFYFWIA